MTLLDMIAELHAAHVRACELCMDGCRCTVEEAYERVRLDIVLAVSEKSETSR